MLSFLENADFEIKNYDIQLREENELTLRNPDIATVSVVQCRCFHDCGDLAGKLLSMSELERYKDFGSEKRRRQSLIGRIAAKNALMQLTKEWRPNEICIVNTQEGYPVIDNCSDYAVSISHSGNYAAAVAFKKDISCGIDLEYINPEKIRALKRLSLLNEPVENDEKSMTIAWCMKESLGKALLCGLNDALEAFRIRHFQKNSNCTYQAEYTHHQQYVGVAKIINADTENNIVCAITHNFK